VSIESYEIASSLEAVASEIRYAAHSYIRLPSYRDDLAAGLESLKERLDAIWAVFLRIRAEEAASAPRK
jgi:hypothetical protein